MIKGIQLVRKVQMTLKYFSLLLFIIAFHFSLLLLNKEQHKYFIYCPPDIATAEKRILSRLPK